MKTIDISIKIGFCQQDELSKADQHLIQRAVEATGNSYSPYSRFRVGAALLLLMVQKLLEPIRRMLLFHQVYVLSVQQSLLLSLFIQTKL